MIDNLCIDYYVHYVNAPITASRSETAEHVLRFDAPFWSVMAPGWSIFGDPMDLCLLRFALPFNLRLPDGNFYYFRASGQLVAVRPWTRQGSRILNYERDSTDWIVQKKAGIHDGQPETPENCVLWLGTPIPFNDFKGGLVIDIDYTVLDLIFEDITGGTLESYKVWAIGVIRGFVDKCRIATNRGWLGEFGKAVDSQAIVGAKAHNATFAEGVFTGDFDSFALLCDLRHPVMYGRRLDSPSTVELDEFKARLASDTDLALHESIFLEAAVQNVRHENHDLAIVHVETAFEVFLQRLLIDHCQRHSTLILPGNKAASQGNQVAIEEGNLSEIFRFVN